MTRDFRHKLKTDQGSINRIRTQIPFNTKHGRIPTQPCTISTRKTLHARITRNAAYVHVGCQWHVTGVLLEYGDALVGVRQRNLGCLMSRARDSHKLECRTTGRWCVTSNILSRRPGRSIAGSMMSGLLVAAITNTPLRSSSPSISVRS